MASVFSSALSCSPTQNACGQWPWAVSFPEAFLLSPPFPTRFTYPQVSLPSRLTDFFPCIAAGCVLSSQAGYFQIVVDETLYSFSETASNNLWATFCKQHCKARKLWRQKEGQELLVPLSFVLWAKRLKFSDSQFFPLEKKDYTHTEHCFCEWQKLKDS